MHGDEIAEEIERPPRDALEVEEKKEEDSDEISSSDDFDSSDEFGASSEEDEDSSVPSESEDEESKASSAPSVLASVHRTLEAFRKRQRNRRRHPTLVYYETLMKTEQNEADRRERAKSESRWVVLSLRGEPRFGFGSPPKKMSFFLSRRYETLHRELKAELLNQQRLERLEANEQFVAKVKAHDERRLGMVTVRRQRELDNTQQRMFFLKNTETRQRQSLFHTHTRTRKRFAGFSRSRVFRANALRDPYDTTSVTMVETNVCVVERGVRKRAQAAGGAVGQ